MLVPEATARNLIENSDILAKKNIIIMNYALLEEGEVSFTEKDLATMRQLANADVPDVETLVRVRTQLSTAHR